MTSPSRRAVTATSVAVALLALPSFASASSTMLTGIADENVLKGQTPGGAAATVAKWKAEGVQDVRTFAEWGKLAPSPDSVKPPAGFNGSDPKAYDFSALDARLDLIRQHGMSVTLVISGPGPLWGSMEPARHNTRWAPNPGLFGQFAAAVAKHVAAKVDRYIIWNEPNVGSWLQPQYKCTSSTKCSPYAPHLYRQLAVAGYDAVHANDPVARVAVGGTSSKGSAVARTATTAMQPLTFLREMSCVTSKYKRKRSGYCKRFTAVKGEALSYHPHSVDLSPGRRDPATANARMADLSRLTSAVDKLTRAKRLRVAGASKMPFWFDEYAYQTSPPDKREGISLKRQNAWTQQGWSIAARSSRVQMLTQYEWFDEPLAPGREELNNGWQSGLFFADGRAKPLAAAFANPIYGWRTSKAGYVWGHARPGNQALQVTLQRKSGSGYRDYKTVSTNAAGQFKVKVPRSSKAVYRYTFVDPLSKQTRTSDAVKLAKG
ncbi:hypothetical protein [Patulibacter defluvii]|uniref:hypothetical protein n=1 Tax=Patulibacter defluvii TaxID=3095358 RepID=UPI002A759334|nr:hypothetical protein [Patulibacter sp. DM4]